MTDTDSDVAPGTMVVVVGPSGAGKDSIIGFAREKLDADSRIGFVQRVITRSADAGSEDHHAVLPQQFAEMRDCGQFAVHWDAHGLSYGIPVETREAVDRGITLIANGSRAVIAEFLKAYPQVMVIVVTAEADVLAERLPAPRREDQATIERRLARSAQAWSIACDHVVIDNSGELGRAGEEFIKIVRQTLEAPQRLDGNTSSLATENHSLS
jgi:ribose 1,5-bisphosphokinase